MKVYVATSFLNIPEARAVMELCIQLGHTITHDWTHESIQGLDKEAAELYLDKAGKSDFLGVCNADCLILIVHSAGRDCYTEWGVALGRNIPSIVLYPHRRPRSIFQNMLGVYVADDIPQMMDVLKQIKLKKEVME
jgi:hypothetical protein